MSEFDKAYDPTQGRNEGQDSNAAKRAESGSIDRQKMGLNMNSPDAILRSFKDHTDEFKKQADMIGSSRQLSTFKTKLDEAYHWLRDHFGA